ncbi:MAG: hypothetical protein AB7S92_18910 [Parvibaculaceae bacterium]
MSNACESAALDRLVEPWAAKIARSSGTTVEAIVSHAENVRDALRELAFYGARARHLLALRSGLSRSAMSKLETIGRYAEPLRRRADTLPASTASLYALARKPWREFEQALEMDLRGRSCAEIKALFAAPSPPRPSRKLMTILVPAELTELMRGLLVADIEMALVRIIERRRIDLDFFLPQSGARRPARDVGHEREWWPADEMERAQILGDDAGRDGAHPDSNQPDKDPPDGASGQEDAASGRHGESESLGGEPQGMDGLSTDPAPPSRPVPRLPAPGLHHAQTAVGIEEALPPERRDQDEMGTLSAVRRSRSWAPGPSGRQAPPGASRPARP